MMEDQRSKPCRISTYLTLETKEYSPEEISAALSVGFDKCNRINEPRGKTGKKWETNIWEIQESSQVSYGNLYDETEACVTRLLTRIESSIGVFRQLTGHAYGQLLIAIVSEQRPGLHFDRKILDVLANLNVDLEIDIICDEPEHV
jgi:hypothetical protein